MLVVCLRGFFIPGLLNVCVVVCCQAFSAMEQLRKHCATEISHLEKSVGSQRELLAALNQSYPELVQKTGKNKRLNNNCTQLNMSNFFFVFTNAGWIKRGL